MVVSIAGLAQCPSLAWLTPPRAPELGGIMAGRHFNPGERWGGECSFWLSDEEDLRVEDQAMAFRRKGIIDLAPLTQENVVESQPDTKGTPLTKEIVVESQACATSTPPAKDTAAHTEPSTKGPADGSVPRSNFWITRSKK